MNDAAQPPDVIGRDGLAWTLFAVLLLSQYCLFREYVERELAPVYPRMFDQSGYLASAYGLHDDILEHGLASAGLRAWQLRSPQTLLFQPEAALLMFFTGASRLGALSLGFLHFALLQLVLVATLRRLSRGWTAPALALGLLLSARTAFGWGGIGDFRTDFSALCLHGLFVCVVLSTNSFAARRAGLYVGAAAVYLALFRYVALIYLGATLLAFGAFLSIASWRAAAAERPAWLARRRNLGMALATLALGMLPVIGASWGLLRSYYWAGQHDAADQHSAGTGEELPGLVYYARSLRDDHAGEVFVALSAAALVVGGLALRRRRPTAERAPVVPFETLPAAAFLATATVAPLVVLALNQARSPIVVGFLVPCLVLLVALPAVVAARRAMGPLRRRLLGCVSAVSVVTGLAVQLDALARHAPPAERADAQQATQLLESVAQVCYDMEWRRPVVLYDTVNEFQMPWAAAVLAYERLRWRFDPAVPIGSPMFRPVEPKALRDGFAAADVAILVRRPPRRGFKPWLAFDSSMSVFREALVVRAEREMVLIARHNVDDWVVDAYARPRLTMLVPHVAAGADWEWITDAGLTLATSATLLRSRPEIRLSGVAQFELIGGELPGISATLLPTGGMPLPLPVSARRHGASYVIQVRCDAVRLPEHGRVLVQLDFDRFFRPVDVGLGPDPRRLVMAAPLEVRLQTPTGHSRTRRAR